MRVVLSFCKYVNTSLCNDSNPQIRQYAAMKARSYTYSSRAFATSSEMVVLFSNASRSSFSNSSAGMIARRCFASPRLTCARRLSASRGRPGPREVFPTSSAVLRSSTMSVRLGRPFFFVTSIPPTPGQTPRGVLASFQRLAHISRGSAPSRRELGSLPVLRQPHGSGCVGRPSE